MAIFRGGPGDDRLTGTSGADELIGFAGNDLLAGGAGADILNGGLGDADAASYHTSRTGVRADLAGQISNTGDARGDTYLGIEQLIGSTKADDLRGGLTNSVLRGRGGDDTLIGQFATTILVGGSGADTLIGQGISTIAGYIDALAGVEVSLGKPSSNTGDADGDVFDNINGLQGSEFKDKLTGDKRDNVLIGLDGDDRLKGGSGNDQLFGGDGADRLIGGKGFDTAAYGASAFGLTVDLQLPANNTGEARGDVFKDVEGIDGTRFNDRLSGDALDNRLSGDLGLDVLQGRDGADTLGGGFGDDRLYGGDGNDILSGGIGADRLVGGDGLDKAIYWTASSGLTVDLARPEDNTGEARGDEFFSIEGIDGSNFSDILGGDELANRLFGRDGGDRLTGRGDDDELFGGRGNDELLGGEGDDTLIGGEGADKLNGGDSTEGIGDSASYALSTVGLTADLGDSSRNTGEAVGDVYSRIENLVGSNFADTLRGDGGANRLTGGGGDDRLEGDDGDDRLIGGAGADTLIGGDGDDTLIGSDGRDFLTGGAGEDTFLFTTAPSASAVDDIADFQLGADVIGLARFQFGALPAGPLSEDAFHAGATATDADQRILHDSATGNILFDADGAGGTAAIRFAQVNAGLVLDAGDFVLV